VQEGPSLVCLAGVLSVCAWHHPLVYTAPVTPISILNLKGDAWVAGVVPRQL
jgi:hypothetical protein